MASETTPRLAIVGASLRAARIAAELDCDVVHLQRPGGPVVALAELSSHIYSVDFSAESFDGFVDTVLRSLRPEAVVSLTETGLLPAARANTRLGLAGTSTSVVRTLNDKFRMRTVLADSGRADLSVRFANPKSGVEAEKVMRGWGPSVMAVLKPRAGSGSSGVHLVDDPAWLSTMGHLSDHILEEYLPGQEYSAETFSVGGRHRLVAVTEKTVSQNFVETGHVIPAPSLTADQVAVVAASVADFLDAIGLRDGPAHTEFKVHEGTVKIIESHNRVGGDGICDLVRLVTGINLTRWSLGWPLGLGAPATPMPAAPAAAVRFAVASPGVISRVTVPANVHPHIHEVKVFVRAGDLVRPLMNSHDRVGRVIATGTTPTEAIAAATAAADAIDVRTRPAGVAE